MELQSLVGGIPAFLGNGSRQKGSLCLWGGSGSVLWFTAFREQYKGAVWNCPLRQAPRWALLCCHEFIKLCYTEIVPRLCWWGCSQNLPHREQKCCRGVCPLHQVSLKFGSPDKVCCFYSQSYRQIRKVGNKVFSPGGAVLWSSESPREAEKQKPHFFYACCIRDKNVQVFSIPRLIFCFRLWWAIVIVVKVNEVVANVNKDYVE